MRAHLIDASFAARATRLALRVTLAGATVAGCAHDTARAVPTTSAPVRVEAPPAAPVAPPSEATAPDRGAAPVEDDVAPPVPGLGSTTHPGGQYGNGTSGTSSDTHKGAWRGADPRPPDPKP